jgi:hypothetical protein
LKGRTAALAYFQPVSKLREVAKIDLNEAVLAGEAEEEVRAGDRADRVKL